MSSQLFHPILYTQLSAGGSAQETAPGKWHLEIPAGPAGQYRLAQLDDYHRLARSQFPYIPPVNLTIRARASTASEIPGTWGFGLWNDPFSLSLGLGGGTRRLPALPNAAWYFFASHPNYLSLRDDLPAQGSLAAVFRTAHWPAPLLAAGAPLLPLLALPPAARLFRRLGRRFIQEDSAALESAKPGWTPADWHEYAIEWRQDGTTFRLDGENLLQTACSPSGPLGLVLWIDNQYAALPPDGRLRYGSLPASQPLWIELENLQISGDGHD